MKTFLTRIEKIEASSKPARGIADLIRAARQPGHRHTPTAELERQQRRNPSKLLVRIIASRKSLGINRSRELGS